MLMKLRLNPSFVSQLLVTFFSFNPSDLHLHIHTYIHVCTYKNKYRMGQIKQIDDQLKTE